MKASHIRWALIGLLVFWLVLNIVFSSEPKTIGVSAEWNNGEYRFAGGTDPVSLMLGVLLFGAYVLVLNAEYPQAEKPLGGVFRRFVAFWLDILVAVLAVGPVLGIVPVVLEWRRTGEFQWTFERTTPAAGDTLQVFLLLPVMFVALIFYHVLPLLRKGVTPGACIMGYRVVPDDGSPLTLKRAIFRTLLGFVALCIWCITPFVGRDRRCGKIWLDKLFATRAVISG